MASIIRVVCGLIFSTLVACSGPKPPPAWPTGQERPINGSPLTSSMPKAVK